MILCMCTQIRTQFILSSEGVGNEELSFFPKGISRWFLCNFWSHMVTHPRTAQAQPCFIFCSWTDHSSSAPPLSSCFDWIFVFFVPLAWANKAYAISKWTQSHTSIHTHTLTIHLKKRVSFTVLFSYAKEFLLWNKDSQKTTTKIIINIDKKVT